MKKDIKTKPTNTKPKILEKASNIPKDAKSIMREHLISQTENLKPEFKDKSQENATDYATLDEKSKAFWEEKTQTLKDLLLVIVTGTTALDEEQRAELAEIIMTYDNIVFETHPAEKLLREDFKKGIKFGDFVLYEFDKIDIDIWQTYNRAYKAHYARYMKKKMTISEFEEWSRFASKIRDKAIAGEISYDDYYTQIRK